MIVKNIGGKSEILMGKRSMFHLSFQFFKLKNFFFVCRSVGFIPSNYVKEKELLGLQQYEYVYQLIMKLFY